MYGWIPVPGNFYEIDHHQGCIYRKIRQTPPRRGVGIWGTDVIGEREGGGEEWEEKGGGVTTGGYEEWKEKGRGGMGKENEEQGNLTRKQKLKGSNIFQNKAQTKNANIVREESGSGKKLGQLKINYFLMKTLEPAGERKVPPK
jgi:hypothetical protein